MNDRPFDEIKDILRFDVCVLKLYGETFERGWESISLGVGNPGPANPAMLAFFQE